MTHTTPPTIADIVGFADQALAGLPERYTAKAGPVSITVEDIAEEEVLDAMGLESGYDVTGLFNVERSSIVLYRAPLLLEWIETGEDLARLVRTALIHELAPHFSLTDADIDALEAAP